MKTKSALTLILLLAVPVFCFSFPAIAEISPEFREDVVEANAKIFSRNDAVIRGVFTDYDIFFLIPEFAKVEAATLHLDLSHAKELIPDLSSLTISLNGKPLQNFFLTPANADHAKISIPFEVADIINGVNSVRFTFFLRSLLIPCADMDNPINWAVLHKDSFVNFKFRITKKVAVGSLENVFCNAGPLFSNDTAFIFGENASEGTLQAAAILANYLGSVSGQAKNIKVFYSNNTAAEDLSKYNVILLGTTDDFPLIAELDQWALRSGMKSISDMKETEALVFMGGSPWANDRFALGIASPTMEGLEKAAGYITSYDLSEVENSSMALSERVLEGFELRPRTKPPEEGSFKRLGYPDMTVSGVFSRKNSVNFRRPTNWKLHSGYFGYVIRHSSFLLPETSGVTIHINDTPVASTKFNGNPDRPLTLIAEIPKQMLGRKNFMAASKFFLDIGQKDCNHQFKDKAWAVVKNNSRFSVTHGFKNTRDLEDFPSILMKNDNLRPSVIMVPGSAIEEEMSLALTLFSNIGAMVPHDPNIPLFRKAESVLPKEFKKRNLVLLGHPRDFTWYQDIEQSLPLGYDAEEDTFQVEAELPNISFEDSYATIQVGPSPWRHASTILLFSAGGRGYEFLRDILSNPDIYGWMSGDFAYAAAGDKVSSFNVKTKAKRPPSEKWLMVLWLVSVILFALFVAGVYWVISRKKGSIARKKR